MVSGTLETSAKVQYLHTLVRGEELCQFDSLYADVEGTKLLTVEAIILGLGVYSSTVNMLLKQKRAMRCRMRKPCRLKVGRYAECLIDFNEYLASFPGEKLNDKIVLMELNENLLNSMPNICSKHAYVQGFDCESITLKRMLIFLNSWRLRSLFMKV